MPDASRVALGAVVALVGFGWAGSALAEGCQDDVQRFTARRQAQVSGLNGSAKSNKGKLDPVAACPRLRALAAVESELVAYMVKNKDWCHIPDEAIANVRAGHAKTAAIAAKACGMVAQIAKMKRLQQQQQAAGGAPGGGGPPAPPRLPAGPL